MLKEQQSSLPAELNAAVDNFLNVFEDEGADNQNNADSSDDFEEDASVSASATHSQFLQDTANTTDAYNDSTFIQSSQNEEDESDNENTPANSSDVQTNASANIFSTPPPPDAPDSIGMVCDFIFLTK